MTKSRIYTTAVLAGLGLALVAGCGIIATRSGIGGWQWHSPSPPAPEIAWVPAGPFRKGDRTPQNVTAIVIHTTEGRFDDKKSVIENQERNFAGVINYFKGNDRNVSAHYVMGPHGEICQMVNEGDIAHTQTYYNGRAFGIECAGWSRFDETWTPELMDSLVELCAYLCVKWEIPAYHPEGTAYEGQYSIILDEDTKRFTGHGLVGHYQVQPWNKSDPGDHFPWEEFSERVRERIREFGGEPIPLPTGEETKLNEMFVSTRIREESVKAGEKFTYSITIRGAGSDTVTVDEVQLPDFSVIEGLETISDLRKVVSEVDRALFEIDLKTPKAGRFSINATRVDIGGTWYDSGTLGVKVEE